MYRLPYTNHNVWEGPAKETGLEEEALNWGPGTLCFCVNWANPFFVLGLSFPIYKREIVSGGPLVASLVRSCGKGSPVPTFLVPAES